QQKVQPAPEQWKFERLNLETNTQKNPQAKEIKIAEYFDLFSKTPFDLENLDINLPQQRLLRSVLIANSDKEHILLVNMHHIVSDGWSMSVLLKEMKFLYETA